MQPVLAVGPDRDGKPAVASFRWEFVPRWATDAKLAPINARAETAADKPIFAESFRSRCRCPHPASGFFEWLRAGKSETAVRLPPRGRGRPFAFAGLWEAWRPESGPPLLTCCILTTGANELVRPVHDRMPVVLDPRHYALWTDRAVQNPADLAPLLRPFAADRMRSTRSTRG